MSFKNFYYDETDYLNRKRLHDLLKNAVEYPLVIICAGSGYGKTLAVHSFLKENNISASWLQISQRDNIPARFWESYSNQVSILLPKTGELLKEIGFPKTDGAFANFLAANNEVILQPGKYIKVFDDFHLLQNPEILRFFERMVSSSSSNMTIIIISRTMPELNIINMIMRERVFTVQEDMLRFTEDEIAQYFSQLKLPVTRENIKNINDDTQGWALALNLIVRSLGTEKKYERYALEAMKKNIFRFLKAEISGTITDHLWRFLLRISLIENLAADLVKILAKDDALIKEMELLNAYIRYDFGLDIYLIHHPFLDFLRQNQGEILTDVERKETYREAGLWCDANGYHTDALYYYEKSFEFNMVTHKIASLNLQIPQDMAHYALEMLERIPSDIKSQDPLFPAMYIKLKLILVKFDEAHVFAQRYAADYEARKETPERNQALAAIYTFWGLIRMKMCAYTDVYDFDEYYKKLNAYYSKNSFNFIGSYKAITAGDWVSNVGTNRSGAMEEYIAAVSRMSSYLSDEFLGFYCGLEEILRGELCFYQRRFNDAEKYMKQSIAKAREYDQYVTQNKAYVYLMHIYFSCGDIKSAKELLRELEALLDEKDYTVRYTIYDIACGFYHLTLDQTEQVPEWLKSEFFPFSHSSFMENYANRIRMRYHYKTRQYRALLTFIENSKDFPCVLFCKMELKVFQALSLYRLKKRSEAIAAFTESYNLSVSNNIKASFTEHANDMRTLAQAALKDKTCQIPKKWLEDIRSISAIYAKRKARMISEYTQSSNHEKIIILTELEIAVLKYLSSGLTRTVIAVNINTSVKEVKAIIDGINKKMGVFSLGEAIRSAADLKII
ncbi:MAG: LuxR C-terminal-related transcriptional regulator [Treponema sp.]|nr:LuxR C-terminal-related transcriptional regulator [Treponema sp.]MCL2272013.1 LuxR C-terminal-related transcriptional regulator [Treponema sp.]